MVPLVDSGGDGWCRARFEETLAMEAMQAKLLGPGPSKKDKERRLVLVHKEGWKQPPLTAKTGG